MRALRTSFLWWIALAAALLVLLVFLTCRYAPMGSAYRTFVSPDQRYKLVVYRSRQLFGPMPGQSGDVPGYVCLYDQRSGKVINRKWTEMVQTIDDVKWTSTNVEIKLFAEWKLR